MPLSEDSRALLQLLLGRGKSYADIAGLLGIEEDEVHRRAAAALAEIEDSDNPPDPDLTDYLLGQADPITGAGVSRRIADDPGLADRAETLTDQLRLLAPGGLPAPTAGPGETPRRPPKPLTPTGEADQAGSGSNRPPGDPPITSRQRRLIALLLGGALLAAVVILLVTGVFGESGDDESDPAEPAPTVAVLEPTAGQQGSGQVQFGFSGSNFAANLQISDLEPSRKGQGYVLWLFGSTGAFPIHASRVEESGAISGQIALNQAVICLIASDFFPTLRLSRVNDEKFSRVLRQSSLEGRENVKLPEYTGKTVLEGSISMPQEAKDAIVPICNGSAAGTPQS